MANTRSYEIYSDSFPLTLDAVNWLVLMYFGGEEHYDRNDPRAAPGNEKDLAGLPPALIYPAGFDPLCDEAVDYGKRLEEAGVKVKVRCYDSLVHGYVNMAAAVPAARKAVREIVADIREALA